MQGKRLLFLLSTIACLHFACTSEEDTDEIELDATSAPEAGPGCEALGTWGGAWPNIGAASQYGSDAPNFWDQVAPGANARVVAVDGCAFTLAVGAEQETVKCAHPDVTQPLAEEDTVQVSHCRDTACPMENPELVVLRDDAGDLLLMGGSGCALSLLDCIPEGLKVELVDESCPAIAANECGKRSNLGLQVTYDQESVLLWPGETGELAIGPHLYQVYNWYSFRTIDWDLACTDQANTYESWAIIRKD